ncbi:unnamed protein product, partial [Closterium sp. Naga37s-1]
SHGVAATSIRRPAVLTPDAMVTADPLVRRCESAVFSPLGAPVEDSPTLEGQLSFAGWRSGAHAGGNE